MKVLIVDDEDHVREGIMLAVDWEKYGVGEVLFGESGAQALELIETHHPAVIFCDMNMPGMDGTELLQRLRQHNRTAQIIVVSGYDNFAYTHATLLAKGVDYLLKPFRKRDLEQALERAVAAWQEHRSHREKEIETGDKIRRADALMDEQKLAGYFKGETGFNEDIRRVFARRGLAAGAVRVALILPGNRTKLLYDRFRGDMELFVFSLNNIAHEVLSRYGTHYLCRLDDYQWLLVTVPENTNTGNRHRYFVEKVADSWAKTLGLQVLIGLYDGEADAVSLPVAISEARSALLRHDLFQCGIRSEALPDKLPHLTDQRLLLETALGRKDKTMAANAIRSFTQSVRNHGVLRLKDLQRLTHEANLMVEKISRAPHAETKAAGSIMPLWIGDFDEWERLLIGIWSALIDESGEEISVRSMETVYDYITNHYHEDLSLPMLAAKFNFNPWYISRKFKEMYGKTVVTYMTELRIGKAKSLLAETYISVSEISNLLGYADENYFSKVFKKQTGLSPLQYRKEQKHGPRDRPLR